MANGIHAPVSRIEPFDVIAKEYDSHFTNTLVGQAQRNSVWREVDREFRSGQRVLEMNCGTGVDAMHLAERGVRVVACDASKEMIEVARRRLRAAASRGDVDLRVLATEFIGQLEGGERFDGALSNFAGLNCVGDLGGVARDLARLVKPGGTMILCLFGRLCLWEIIWYGVHGELKKAFRRLTACRIAANLGPGQTVLVRYPSVQSLRRDFAPHFRLMKWKGIGIFVPPSYLEPLAFRFGRIFSFAAKVDAFVCGWPGFRTFADHVVLEFARVGA
jgi:ubiquinone/menaquinone biosynthesis C-methylase UbiE